MFWGTMLEPVIAQVFSMRMEVPVEWYNQRITSAERPWQYATPDAFILASAPVAGRIGLLECKTTDLHLSGEWDRNSDGEDGVPEHYLAQVQWQMSVCRLDFAYIAVLIAGNDFRIYRIDHDPVLEDILVEAGETFWRQHILTKVEPPISGSEAARQYLRHRYPREREKLRPATEEEVELLDQYAELRGLLKLGGARRKTMENQITQAIGDHEGLEWDRGKLTWKRTKDRRFVNWEGLAKSQIRTYSEQEQKDFIQEYTLAKPGYRRIHFNDEDDE
jgi:predicted phage-related endonuclease